MAIGIRFAAFLLLTLGSTAANADQVWTNADLACSKDTALARFALSYDKDPVAYAVLPGSLDGGLSKSNETNRTDCHLSNGWTIRIRAGEEQGFAYGLGGGNPPAFFSLWINHRKVLSKFVWKPGYEASFDAKPLLVGLVIESGKMTFCYQDEDSKTVHCEPRVLELEKYAIDQDEYPSQPKPPAGTVVIESQRAVRPFCEHFLAVIDQKTKGAWSNLPVWNAFPTFGGTGAPPVSEGLTDLTSFVGSLRNLNNRRVVTIGGTNHYFDGDIAVIAPHQVPIDAIKAELPGRNIDAELSQSFPSGWTVIAGGTAGLYPKVSPRYVHLVPEKIADDLYFFAFPTNENEQPGGILVKPEAAGGFTSVCSFSRVPPHF